MIRLLGIDPAKVYVQACLYETFVRDVCRRCPADFTLPLVQEQVQAKAWQLWIAFDIETASTVAVCATELLTGHDGKTTINVLFCTGRGVRRWLHLIDEIQDWGRRNGAVRFKAMTRPGWERLLTGYRKTHVVLEKDLA